MYVGWEGGNQLEMSVLFLQLPDRTKFCFDVTIFIQATLIRVSTLYFIIFVKKEINTCIRINNDVFFYKNHDGELGDMSRNYPRLIFFKEVITEHHF